MIRITKKKAYHCNACTECKNKKMDVYSIEMQVSEDGAISVTTLCKGCFKELKDKVGRIS